jgi:hypothetical protein
MAQEKHSIHIVLAAAGDPNARNQSGMSSLMLAAWSFERTRLLVDKGADVNAKSSSGITPLWVALSSPGNEQTARYLFEKGADTKYIMPNGADDLMRAALTINAEFIRMLLKKGIDPHQADKAGNTGRDRSPPYDGPDDGGRNRPGESGQCAAVGRSRSGRPRIRLPERTSKCRRPDAAAGRSPPCEQISDITRSA